MKAAAGIAEQAVKLLSMRGRRVAFSIATFLESDPHGYCDLHVVHAFHLENAHAERCSPVTAPFRRGQLFQEGVDRGVFAIEVLCLATKWSEVLGLFDLVRNLVHDPSQGGECLE